MILTKNVQKAKDERAKEKQYALKSQQNLFHLRNRESISVFNYIPVVEDTELKKPKEVYSWHLSIMSVHKMTHRIQWIQNGGFFLICGGEGTGKQGQLPVAVNVRGDCTHSMSFI